MGLVSDRAGTDVGLRCLVIAFKTSAQVHSIFFDSQKFVAKESKYIEGCLVIKAGHGLQQ